MSDPGWAKAYTESTLDHMMSSCNLLNYDQLSRLIDHANKHRATLSERESKIAQLLEERALRAERERDDLKQRLDEHKVLLGRVSDAVRTADAELLRAELRKRLGMDYDDDDDL